MNWSTTTRRSVAAEIGIVTAVVLIIAHALFRMRAVPWIGSYLAVIIAIILLYVPVAALWLRRRPLDYLDRSFRSFMRSIAAFVIAAIIIFPAFFVVAHFWQVWIKGYELVGVASFPSLDRIILYQLFMVSLPEEFYFRGYVQSAMNMIFKPKWRILGVRLGWGWILTAVIFSFAHSIIFYQWWHFAIFFPALVFGYLRERTGSVTAPTLFHALSNILMNWFGRCYA